jgi:hypothetical protein
MCTADASLRSRDLAAAWEPLLGRTPAFEALPSRRIEKPFEAQDLRALARAARPAPVR